MQNALKGFSFFVLLALYVFPTTGAFAQRLSDLSIYGYFSTRYEKVFNEPSLDDSGNTVKDTSPGEWDYPYVNIMMQSRLSENVKVYVNLDAGGGETVDVKNIWGDYSFNEAFNIRIGKIYRKFGLYNEILDAVPTYIGIEAPELFDQDHLILSRTTVVMFHGKMQLGDNTLNYSISTDGGEGDRDDDTFPLGFDVNYRFLEDTFVIGASGYSSMGKTASDVDLGRGSPRSGVLPWMAEDEFNVYGAYMEATPSNFVLQAAYWHAAHSAERDPEAVLTVIQQAGINNSQLSRFLKNPSDPLDTANVDTNVDYDIDTFYFRGGYSFEVGNGELTPYIQWDWYKNPETIANKTFGGDNEAGVADDGRFSKGTIGIVYMPMPKLAIKIDGSSHFYKFNGKDESYPEIRFDVSYVFGL